LLLSLIIEECLLMASDRFAPHREKVAAETVDGMAILIHLSTGAYYSLEGSAATVWAAIEQQGRVPEIVAALTATYDVAQERAAADVDRLLGELVREELIVPAAADPAQDRLPPSATESGTATTARLPYQPPQLDIFSDLSPLLANDPPVLIRPLSAHD
jgi:hypothetical protein